MNQITLHAEAPAKINLSLDVLRKRPDGYHDLVMVMQTIGICDTMEIKILDRPEFTITTNKNYLPHDTRNLALAAAKLFFEKTGSRRGVAIGLIKKIPVCGGLGGGSADAAAVLRALASVEQVDEAKLSEWALELGSDVPFCLQGGTMLAEGRGEKLTRLPDLPPCYVVLTKPDVLVSTRSAFQGLNAAHLKRRPDTKSLVEAIRQSNIGMLSRHMYNVFEEPLSSVHKSIAMVRSTLIECGALGAVLSGTGPTVFGIFEQPGKAQSAFETLKADYPDTFLAPVVSRQK